MMEFLPANKAYQATPLVGFRTFIQVKGKVIWGYLGLFGVS